MMVHRCPSNDDDDDGTRSRRSCTSFDRRTVQRRRNEAKRYASRFATTEFGEGAKTIELILPPPSSLSHHNDNDNEAADMMMEEEDVVENEKEKEGVAEKEDVKDKEKELKDDEDDVMWMDDGNDGEDGRTMSSETESFGGTSTGTMMGRTMYGMSVTSRAALLRVVCVGSASPARWVAEGHRAYLVADRTSLRTAEGEL